MFTQTIMVSTNLIIAYFVAVSVLVAMQSNSAMGRPTQDQKKTTQETLTNATEIRMHNKIDTNVAVQQAKAVSNKSEIKSESVQMPFTPNNSDNPSLVIREKRWDGCGYKGIC